MGRPENPLDPDAGPVQRFAVELRALRDRAGRPTYRAMAHRSEYSAPALSQAAAGERLPTLPVTLAYIAACGGDPAEWERRWKTVADEIAAVPHEEQGAQESPYRGLARFEPDDAEVFFGREQLVDEVTELVRGHRCAVVLGPSGSGKSSLLRAGLIPRLRRTTETGLDLAAIRIVTPGAHPVRTHADKLRPADRPGDTLVLVDQFEEVFTLCPDPEERARFIDLLLAARERGSRLRVVLGVRADFYGRCLEHPELVQVVRDAGVPVPVMGREELREAIVKPAMARGLTVERALTAQLVQEVAGEPGGLPLLSHALLETWRRRSGRTLTLRAYEAAGGVRGAIAQTAEDLYAALPEDQAHLVRRVLLRLIAPGEGTADTCRPVERTELHTRDPRSAEAVDTVLERLAHARLITLDGDTVHLAHEALITAWPRLRAWIEDDRHRLRALRRLTEAAAAWRELGRDPGALYRGARLAEAAEAFSNAEHTRELTVEETDFLTASRNARTRERRWLGGLLSSLSVLLVLALVAGTVAWQQHRTSQRQHLDAAARRAATAAAGLRTTDPSTALRLSVAAWQLSHSPETRSALVGAFAQHDLPTFTPPGGSADASRITPDGRTLIGFGAGRMTRWDLRTGRRIDSHRLPTGAGDVAAADVSPDGRYMGVSTTDVSMRMRLWDTRTHRYHGPVLGPTGTELPERLPSDSPTRAGEDEASAELGVGAGGGGGGSGWSGFSPTGHALFFGMHDHLEVWSGDSGRPLFTHTSPALSRSNGGDISPDNRLVAVCAQGNVLVWDVRSHRRIDTAWHQRTACEAGSDIQFAPDGRTLALLDATGLQRLSVSTGKRLPRLHQMSPLSYVFSTDGKLLAAWGSSDILLWRLDHPQAPVFRHPLTDARPTDLRMDTTARILRYTTTQLSEEKIVVHNLDISSALKPHWNDHAIATAALSTNGAVLAVLDTRGKGASGPRIFDGPTGRLRYHISAAGPPPTSAVFVNDDATVMSLSADGTRLAFGSGPPDDMENPTRITVWDTVHNRRLADFRPYGGERFLAGLTLSPDGRDLMTTNAADDSLTIWDAETGRRLRVVHRHDAQGDGTGSAVSAVSGDGHVLLTSDGTVLPVDGHERQRTLPNCSCVGALSPDGSVVAFTDISGGIRLWDARSATSLGVLPGGFFKSATGDVEDPKALSFSPDGSTLAAAGSDGTLRLWDVDSRQQLGTDLPTAGDEIVSLAFSGDGGTLYAAGRHVRVQRFDLDPAHVSAWACRRSGGTLSRTEWRTYLADVSYRSVC